MRSNRGPMKSWSALFFVAALAACSWSSGCRFDRSGLAIRPTCGNGTAEQGEQCDGADLAGQTCISLGYSTGSLICSPSCTFDYSDCRRLSCGNGHRDEDEDCEGSDLNETTCQSLGYDEGTLACTSNCFFDTTGCRMFTCGNGEIDTNEECDGTNLGGESCETQGYYGGDLACTGNCYFDLSDCRAHGRCGDGVRNPPYEECEGNDLGGESCTSLQYHGGTLVCGTSCRFDRTDCLAHGFCGDNVLNQGYEDCEGSDLGDHTCAELGHDAGDLACTPLCTLNEAGCIDYQCGNGSIEPGEDCEGNNFNGESCASLGHYEGELACTGCHFDFSGCAGECGDDITNHPWEVCDGIDLDGMTCGSFGFEGGLLHCQPDCQNHDTSDCTSL